MQASSNSSDDKSGEKKRQTRGGKGIPKGKKKFEAQKIVLNKQQRKGNKFVTIVQGLASNGMRENNWYKRLFFSFFVCRS
jgi:translation initiation factor 1 (eIF-1/SUI1)